MVFLFPTNMILPFFLQKKIRLNISVIIEKKNDYDMFVRAAINRKSEIREKQVNHIMKIGYIFFKSKIL